jgi:hypothetical protein
MVQHGRDRVVGQVRRDGGRRGVAAEVVVHPEAGTLPEDLGPGAAGGELGGPDDRQDGHAVPRRNDPAGPQRPDVNYRFAQRLPLPRMKPQAEAGQAE